MKNRLLVSAGALLLCATLSSAQDIPTPVADTVPLTQLEPVVVTATRSAMEARKTGASVTVISRDDIEKKQYHTLTDALRNVPGLSLAESGTPGQAVTVVNRGLPTRFTSILVDGKPLASGLSFDGNLTNLDLDNVERIEVVQGALSSVQGGSAVAGAINIITRKGRGLQKSLEGEVTAEAGSYNTFREAVSARGAVDKFFYSATASRLDTTFQRANNDYENTHAGTNLGYEATPDVTLELTTDYRTALSGNPGQNRGFGANSPTNYLLVETWDINPSVSWQTTEDWQQVFSYRHDERRQPSRNGNTYSRAQIDDNSISHDNTWHALENLTVTGGWSAQDSKFQNDSFGAYANNNTNVAGQVGLDWEALGDWHILPSFRLDHYSDYGSQANYRIASSYKIAATQTIVHGSYGTAFSPVEEQNIIFSTPPNPNLQPERSEGFDFGLEQPFWHNKASVGATYFQNNIENLIAFQGLAAVNFRAVRTQGLTTFYRLQPWENITTTLTYTYTDAQNLSTHSRLPRTPEHKFGAEISYQPIPVVSLTLGGDWNVNREDVDPVSFVQTNQEDYFTARVAVSWQAQKHCQVFLRLENALNEQYEEVAGYPALDRAIYGGVKLSY